MAGMITASNDSIELSEIRRDCSLPCPKADFRPKMPEPLPVRLVTVDDARLPTAAGCERELDRFYVGLLQMERETDKVCVVYRADNFRLRFTVIEPPIHRVEMRALGIEVLSLRDAEHKLIASETEYVRQKGLLPGEESLLLRDPAGNWIELSECRELT